MLKATFNETLTELIGNDVYTVEVLEYNLDFTAHILLRMPLMLLIRRRTLSMVTKTLLTNRSAYAIERREIYND